MDFNQQTTVGPTSSSTRQKIAGRAGVKRSPQKKRARCKNKKYQIAKNRLGSPKRVAQSAFLR